MTTLTIGMATANDFDGVYFTLQSLRLYHQHALAGAEFLVVDNQPKTAAGEMTRALVAHWIPGGRYVPLPDPPGTTQTRQAIFDEARGELVLVLDCHVLLAPGGLAQLLAWYADNPDSRDMLTGPLMFDHFGDITTHFNEQWRGEMWGTWGAAWRCGCNRPGALRFSPVELKAGWADLVALAPGLVPVRSCGACGRQLPGGLAWAGHDKTLAAAGYVRLALDPDEETEPFEIPANGLGLFACRRTVWPGFNRHMRGFGGEECYIHEKIRRAGGRNLCAPWLRWVHRFGRPAGVPYPLTRWNKVRNYVLGHNELGRPLDAVHAHFVASGLMTESDWAYLLADPLGHIDPPGTNGPPGTGADCGTCPGNNRPQPPAGATLEQLLEFVVATPRDLDQHARRLAGLAGQVEHVTEFTKRRESTVALLAGLPSGGTLDTFTTEPDPLLAAAAAAADRKQLRITEARSAEVPAITETDLLFIDSTHTAATLADELAKFAPNVRRYIVLHDTAIHGETGEDGGPGLLVALRQWLRSNPNWSVVEHTEAQYGLTVLSCWPADKPALPGKLAMVANLAATVAAHVKNGLHKVTADQLEARLLVCAVCDQRRDDRCAKCGCYLNVKAIMRAAECPLGKWPAVPADGE